MERYHYRVTDSTGYKSNEFTMMRMAHMIAETHRKDLSNQYGYTWKNDLPGHWIGSKEGLKTITVNIDLLPQPGTF